MTMRPQAALVIVRPEHVAEHILVGARPCLRPNPAKLRRLGAFAHGNEPNLGALLDLVALGTVADVVRLDQVNRILVAQGLSRIRNGRAHPGIAALFAVAGRDAARATAFDLGFVAGPRLNAAGRITELRRVRVREASLRNSALRSTIFVYASRRFGPSRLAAQRAAIVANSAVSKI